MRVRRLRARRLAMALGLALPVPAHRAGAQQIDSIVVGAVQPTAKAATPTMMRSNEVSALRVGAAIAVTGVLVAPFDVAITRRLRSPDLQNSASWRAGAVVFDAYGAPGSQVVGPLLAIAGSVTRNPTMSDVGIHLAESYATAGAAVFVIKGIAGRARPYAVSSESAYDFALGRGFPHREPFSSFPSGHSTGSFAFASSLTVE
ncbi:MAG: phosphatase PAP2 family protein, partial [Gemmatimonadetes bacterium]|nr:phosphatase PAP2 family protein [Gemmatimonadota bacterium]